MEDNSQQSAADAAAHPGGYPMQPPYDQALPGGYPMQPPYDQAHPGGYPMQPPYDQAHPGGYPMQPPYDQAHPGGYPMQPPYDQAHPGGYPMQPPYDQLLQQQQQQQLQMFWTNQRQEIENVTHPGGYPIQPLYDQAHPGGYPMQPLYDQAHPGRYPMQPPNDQLLQQQQQLQMFWTNQRQEIENVNDFKNHQLPLARIKKIMKADEDVRMISAEVPILFAKACELFVLELTIRSWFHAEENKRRTLQKNDIAAAIRRTDILDFLLDVFKEKATGLGPGMATGLGPGMATGLGPGMATGLGPGMATGLGPGMAGSAASDAPYYFPPMVQPDPSGVMMGSPAMPMVDPSTYVQPPPPPSQAWHSVWEAAEDYPYATGGNSGQDKLDGQS